MAFEFLLSFCSKRLGMIITAFNAILFSRESLIHAPINLVISSREHLLPLPVGKKKKYSFSNKQFFRRSMIHFLQIAYLHIIAIYM